ncbi:MAG: NAD(P)H-hydrate dehydratase [Pseudohongiella sp.]|nr:NAD(P)H-hydrate dehydratase [Pseudohongiella sp.]
MIPLFTSDQVRHIDQQAIDSGITGYALMQRAASAALRAIAQRWPQARHLMVFCGGGNNGGDGYEIARQALINGLDVQVFMLRAPDDLQGDAQVAARAAEAAGVSCQLFEAALAEYWFLSHHVQHTVLIDALLGIGCKGALRADYAQAVDFINRCAAPVLAIDVPTGVCADTGHVDNQAVVAQICLTLVARKQGLYTGDAPAFVGELRFDDLGIAGGVPSARGIDSRILHTAALARKRTAHKGDSGHVLVIGGDSGFGGAALMAAQAAARSGAGTVSLITRTAHVTAMLTRCPEVMVHGVDQIRGEAADSALKLLNRAGAVVLGPGLGRSPWSLWLLHAVLARAAQRQIPLVLDADALNLLAQEDIDWQELAPVTQRAQWILTPHPGEAARLLACDTAAINRDRFSAVRALQLKTACVVVLKGAGSLLAFPEAGDMVDICLEGNPGMATGGMGDVLSGICGAMLALGQCGEHTFNASEAARFAVCAHGEAADLAAAEIGQRGLLATDLFRFLPALLSGESGLS